MSNIHCMKCKSKTKDVNESIVEGLRRRRVAECGVCGTKKTVFIAKGDSKPKEQSGAGKTWEDEQDRYKDIKKRFLLSGAKGEDTQKYMALSTTLLTMMGGGRTKTTIAKANKILKELEELTVQAGGNAKIAREVYQAPEKRAKEIDGFKLDESSNRRDSAVYVNDKGKAFVAHRGTDVTNKKKAISDLAEDALIVAGLSNTALSKRNTKANKLIKEAVDKYGKGNVVLTGHSLGGRVALNTAEKNDLKAKVYNPGSSPVDIPANLLKKKNKKVKIVSTGIDPLSATAYHTAKTKKKKVKAKSLDLHGIDNFIDDQN